MPHLHHAPHIIEAALQGQPHLLQVDLQSHLRQNALAISGKPSRSTGDKSLDDDSPYE